MTAYSIDVGVSDFQEKVLDASRLAPVLVDFWAEWCAPCRMLKPILEKLAAEYGGRFILAKLDSDRHQEIAARYGVRGIPNVKAFVNGEIVDEITGAVPEEAIRSFIERLMPSPAEPLRVAAQAARAQGDTDVARSLLADALELDPANETVQLDLAEIHIDMQDIDAAKSLLVAIEHTARDTERVRTLLARLNLVAAGGNADPAPLKARIEANADDLDARLQLANTLALSHEYRAALEHLLEIVRRDRGWQDEAARKTMLDLFTLLGGDPQQADLVREFRIQLARTLN
ncbi:MAG: tetratricopeptide repeat protein [Burkholderiaceae bacterium]|nr:tetratricopeptide repeat protein [Sulfuritalea sp.]MCF8173775.1 tetratricopeptide repeat protein [Burkholderiaceae bacterium]